MHLGRAVVTAVAAIAVGQKAGEVLPSDFCTPECPQCKNAVTSPFDTNTLCIPNSTFMVNCGSCQTCIWTYGIENPDLPISNLEVGIQTLLDLCLNTTANDEVVELASQVSRISVLGNVLTSGHTPTTTYSQFTTTKTGQLTTWTVTGVVNPSWTTILSTATWASEYYSRKSAEASASSAAGKYNQTASAVVDGGGMTVTAAPIAPTEAPPAATVEKEPTSKNWLIGPVVGSVLGVTAIATALYFMRRKFLRHARAREDAARLARDKLDDSGESHFNIEMGELENTEVHELAAPEPVGSELNTPRDGHMDPIEEWPLPLSPLPFLFAMTELRDKRAEHNNSPKHETYYNP